MSNIDDRCFVAQTVDEKILLHVTNVCGECYRDLHAGEPIYYDLQAYRYLCEACAEHLSEQMNDACEIVEESGGSLF
jgi:predicted amidophosphoribosyltransferase